MSNRLQSSKPKVLRKLETRLYLYGLHAVRAALANPRRKVNTLLLALGADHPSRRLLEADLAAHPNPPHVSETVRGHLDKLVGKAAVHQDVVAFVKPLPNEDLHSFLRAFAGTLPTLALLDQVTDPHNVGAILRSAAAFGVGALITPARYSPQESGLIGRVASGGLDVVPWLRVRNLAQSCQTLRELDYELVGLAGQAQEVLTPGVFSDRPQALIFGSEGQGLRMGTRALCDRLLRLPTRPPIADLNVSNAAAVSFFALTQARSG